MNKKTAIWIIVAIVVIGGIWFYQTKTGSQTATQNTEGKILKIGAILPLSGPIASAGGFAKNGIEEALADIAEDKNLNIEVIFEDGQYDAKTSVSAYNKLKTVDGVDALIVFGTPSVMSIAPLVNADRIPLLGLLAAPNYSSPDDFTFRMMGHSDTEAKFASDILVDKLGKKKIAVMYLNNDYGTGALASFKKYVAGRATVVAEEGSAPGTTDYRAQLTKIKNTAPDAIFLATLYKEGGLIVKQAKEMGIAGPFMCGQPCDVPELITTAGAASEGLIVVAPTDKNGTGFIDEYQKIYGARPSYLALRTYDATNILNSIAPNCASSNFSGDCLKKQIDDLNGFPGLSYPINFDNNGDINDQFVVKVIKNGKYEAYE
ncbi:MAG: ABC transporter substrate-binding protein [Patescibacteria group bacterium]